MAGRAMAQICLWGCSGRLNNPFLGQLLDEGRKVCRKLLRAYVEFVHPSVDDFSTRALTVATFDKADRGVVQNQRFRFFLVNQHGLIEQPPETNTRVHFPDKVTIGHSLFLKDLNYAVHIFELYPNKVLCVVLML